VGKWINIVYLLRGQNWKFPVVYKSVGINKKKKLRESKSSYTKLVNKTSNLLRIEKLSIYSNGIKIQNNLYLFWCPTAAGHIDKEHSIV